MRKSGLQRSDLEFGNRGGFEVDRQIFETFEGSFNNQLQIGPCTKLARWLLPGRSRVLISKASRIRRSQYFDMSANELWKSWRNVSSTNNPEAIETLWVTHHGELVRIAHEWLDRMLHRSQDQEGNKLTAFDFFCRGGDSGVSESLRGADELWRIIATLVTRRIVVSQSADAVPIANAQTRDLAQQMTSELRKLLNLLADADLEMVVLAKLSGATDNAVAHIMECTRRTVQRMLRVIRSIWQNEVDHSGKE